MVLRVLVLLLVLGLSGCMECDTEGCDALQNRVQGRESGIGGVVAEKSDVVANGCEECGFSQASIEVFQLDAGAASAEAAAASIDGTPPLETIAASERYHANLEPGAYLLCVLHHCIGVDVAADAVTTVNIKRRYGPTSFFIVDPASGKFREDFGFARGGSEN